VKRAKGGPASGSTSLPFASIRCLILEGMPITDDGLASEAEPTPMAETWGYPNYLSVTDFGAPLPKPLAYNFVRSEA
jgi:hypothetical protein